VTSRRTTTIRLKGVKKKRRPMRKPRTEKLHGGRKTSRTGGTEKEENGGKPAPKGPWQDGGEGTQGERHREMNRQKKDVLPSVPCQGNSLKKKRGGRAFVPAAGGRGKEKFWGVKRNDRREEGKRAEKRNSGGAKQRRREGRCRGGELSRPQRCSK